jgi:hypothetical protein
MSNFQNPKVPPTGGSHLPHAHPRSFEMRQTEPVPKPSDLATFKYSHPSRAVSQRGIGRSLQKGVRAVSGIEAAPGGRWTGGM